MQRKTRPAALVAVAVAVLAGVLLAVAATALIVSTFALRGTV